MLWSRTGQCSRSEVDGPEGLGQKLSIEKIIRVSTGCYELLTGAALVPNLLSDINRRCRTDGTRVMDSITGHDAAPRVAMRLVRISLWRLRVAAVICFHCEYIQKIHR